MSKFTRAWKATCQHCHESSFNNEHLCKNCGNVLFLERLQHNGKQIITAGCPSCGRPTAWSEIRCVCGNAYNQKSQDITTAIKPETHLAYTGRKTKTIFRSLFAMILD